jgi:hypothetical protein
VEELGNWGEGGFRAGGRRKGKGIEEKVRGKQSIEGKNEKDKEKEGN